MSHFHFNQTVTVLINDSTLSPPKLLEHSPNLLQQKRYRMYRLKKKTQQIYSLAYCPTNWYSKLKKEIKKNLIYAIADITPYACETS